MQKILLLLLTLFTISTFTFSQHHHLSEGKVVHEPFQPFRIAVMMGHTSIPSGEQPDRIFIPSWGLDIEYWFNDKWGIGNHNDIEVESYMVQSHDEEVIEREYPLVTTLELLYNPWKGLVLQTGPGFEHEKEKNYTVLRFGVEYEFHLPDGWDVFPTLFYDTRIAAFDTWTIGLGVGKLLSTR